MPAVNPISAVQQHNFNQVALVPPVADTPGEEPAVMRWAIEHSSFDGSKTTPIDGTAKIHVPNNPVIRMKLLVTNIGENEVDIKLQESEGDNSDNQPAEFSRTLPPVETPLAFEQSFTSDIGSAIKIAPGATREMEATLTKPFVQIKGTGPGTIRVQGSISVPYYIMGILAE